MDQLIKDHPSLENKDIRPNLFSPLTVRSITFRNRIMVSPMCQYSATDGLPNDWHLVNLGSRAVGGASLVCFEASAVEARGRISAQDLGIWSDAHIPPYARINEFIRSQGAVPGIQLAHAGRKAAVQRPWEGGGPLSPEEGAWSIVGPSPIPFDHNYQTPQALTKEEIAGLVEEFRLATIRSLKAGFDVIEVHAAHGYLVHQFLSPLSNQRQDEYGGSLKNRSRFLLEIVDAIRSEWPDNLPLVVRISATDWVEGGWDITQSVELCRELGNHKVDLIDCSSGGNSPLQKIPLGPGYQVPFAQQIRRETGISTIAVGLIFDPGQANQIILDEEADMVALARELLRDPYFPMHAARALDMEMRWPEQYLRAKR